MRIYTCDPHTEMFGGAMMSHVNNVNHDIVNPILEKHGIVNLQPDQWYPLQNLLDAFNEIAQMDSSLSNLVAIGVETATMMPFPPEVEGLPLEAFFLNVIPSSFHHILRNGYGGEIMTEKAGERRVKIIDKTLFPDDLEYGVIYGFARRFAKGKYFALHYEEGTPRRDEGAAQSVMFLDWE